MKVNEIISKETRTDIILSGINIYKVLGELLTSHLHIIIPLLCELMISQEPYIDNILRLNIVNLFKILTNKCSFTVYHLNQIVSCLVLGNILIFN